MSGHLAIHYLDMIRHGLAFTWTWTTWIGNISAGIIVFFVGSLFWPRARRAIEAFAKKHVKSIHDKLDAQHEERLRQAEDHHVRSQNLAKKHHAEVLSALKPESVVKKATPRKGLAPRKEAP